MRDQYPIKKKERYYVNHIDTVLKIFRQKDETQQLLYLRSLFVKLYDDIDYRWEREQALQYKLKQITQEYESGKQQLAILKAAERLSEKLEKENAREKEENA